MNKLLQHQPIFLGSPGEEISIQDLQSIKHRFKILNQFREQRVKEFLPARQQVFLEILPLLFHCNFPMLPGFISVNTPAGIPEYIPDSQALQAAKKLAIDFSYARTPSHLYPIEGLFLMGNVSSIAFSKSSNMEVWLCHQSDLSVIAVDELQKKAAAIESWAVTLGLEVHFFLIDSKQFRFGENTPTSTESVGQAQHYLVLEEFYRKAIYIAGKSPAWWFVPPHEEGNYTRYINHLIDNRFIHAHELIDFGGFDAVPAEEFIIATLWHLYKTLHSPRKSLLKLLLMECYTGEYCHTEWLCLDVKKAVYQGTFMSTDLDPYFLIYQKVEEYLQSNHSHERLALVRQSFYLKVIESSDQIMDAPIRAFRDKYMQYIIKQWNWTTPALNELKQPLFWNIKKAIADHTVILQQLSRCYRMITEFSKGHAVSNPKNSDNLKLISRNLRSFFEKKPGKVQIITTHADVHSKENALYIVENSPPGGNGWALYLKANAADSEVIQKCRTLIEVLAWLVVNGLYHKHLQLNFSSHSLDMSNEELHSILRQINLFLTLNFTYTPPLDVYQVINTQLNSFVIINMGILDNERLCVVSDRSDPLSYGLNRQCFIQTINRISLSSWGEITTSQDEGLIGLFNCFTDIVNNNKKPLSLKNLKFICHTPKRARDIIFRVEVVFSILVKLFAEPQLNCSPRYILPGGTSFYVFQTNNKALGYKALATEQLLLNELARPQELFSTVHLDKNVLENTPIQLIYSLNKPQVIQLFYYEHNADITVYVVDEKGTLYVRQHNTASAVHLLKQYSVFLESIISRSMFDKFLTIKYYAIEKSPADVFSCNQVHLKTADSNGKLSLRITGEDSPKGVIYTIYCNEQEFSSLDHGNRVFYAAYQHILQFRNSEVDYYPIHITDIDLPISVFRIDNQAQLQTLHYLNYKQKIEDKFNTPPPG